LRNEVRYLRRSKEFDITQEELAQAVGVSKSAISAIENERGVSAELLLKISIFFNRDPRDIFFIDGVNY